MLDWRWMFLLVLPIALATSAFGARRIENGTTPIDGLSMLLPAIGFVGFAFGLSGLCEAALHPTPMPA